ncbi:MAG: hypothetical protein AAGK22_10965, partial [Acidobacteriota bacterium]
MERLRPPLASFCNHRFARLPAAHVAFTLSLTFALLGLAHPSEAADCAEVFEGCESWSSPFESRSEWLSFMAEGVTESEVTALAAA